MNSALPAPMPRVDPENKPFWDATREGRLLLKRCRACDAVHWYPRVVCPRCGSLDTEWTDAAGQGTVYTFTIVHRGEGEYAGGPPYVLAYVQLDEGPRMLTNVVDIEPADVAIGQRVEVVFHRTSGDAALPRFRPVDAISPS